jgi:hypothetical protein
LDDGVEEAESIEHFLELDDHVAVHEEIVAGDGVGEVGTL